MDPKQRSHILKSLFKIPIDEIGDKLILELKFIIDRSDDAEILKPKLLDLLINGINNLNLNQFNNLLKQINENSITDSEILMKLKFYEVKEEFHNNILSFFQDYKTTLNPINVEKLDITFKGLQVATRDDFNKILIDGYTGDWVVSPANIYTSRIQIASMNETGSYPEVIL